MNSMTELEVKFKVPALTVGKFKSYFDVKVTNQPEYVTLAGVDTFFSGNGIVLRYRRAAPGEPVGGTPALTYKCRQEPGNIRERIELDIFLDERRVKEETVKAFVAVLGLKEHFTILKESHIFKQEFHSSHGNYTVVAALYDVLHDGKIDRFLEVEIDKDGTVDDEYARGILQSWISGFQRDLGVGEPVNKSLYEMYAPRDELFLPETF